MMTKTNSKRNILILSLALGMSIFEPGCSEQKSSNQTIDENRIKAIAANALKNWIQENPTNSAQIEGAQVVKIEKQGQVIHIIFMKDNSINNLEGIHKAYFHVYLDKSLEVIKVVRGPDEIS